jgi:hypothetical protein
MNKTLHVAKVTSHEIGHCFGLHHHIIDKLNPTIMGWPYGDASTTWKEGIDETGAFQADVPEMTTRILSYNP